MVKEIENPGFFQLMFANGFIIEEKVHYFFLGIHGIEPSNELFSSKGPFRPVLFRKPEGNVITEAEIAEQHPELGVEVVAIYVVRTFPP